MGGVLLVREEFVALRHCALLGVTLLKKFAADPLRGQIYTPMAASLTDVTMKWRNGHLPAPDRERCAKWGMTRKQIDDAGEQRCKDSRSRRSPDSSR
jgi:hypothetical protein